MEENAHRPVIATPGPSTVEHECARSALLSAWRLPGADILRNGRRISAPAPPRSLSPISLSSSRRRCRLAQRRLRARDQDTAQLLDHPGHYLRQNDGAALCGLPEAERRCTCRRRRRRRRADGRRQVHARGPRTMHLIEADSYYSGGLGSTSCGSTSGDPRRHALPPEKPAPRIVGAHRHRHRPRRRADWHRPARAHQGFFHWDTHGTRDEKSSCRIRVGQSLAGSSWGGLFTPRIGQGGNRRVHRRQSRPADRHGLRP